MLRASLTDTKAKRSSKQKIRRRVRTATQKERTESRRKKHMLPKESESNMTKGSIEGNTCNIAKKAEADASIQI